MRSEIMDAAPESSSLIKNIPNKSEPWKAPVKDWLHEMDEKRQKKAAQKQKRKAASGGDGPT